MTTEEALSDEAVYQRRKLILRAIDYELKLLRVAITEIEDALTKNRTAHLSENAIKSLEDQATELDESECNLSYAESGVYESMSGSQMIRFETDNE
jgi:hypothetical protein